MDKALIIRMVKVMFDDGFIGIVARKPAVTACTSWRKASDRQRSCVKGSAFSNMVSKMMSVIEQDMWRQI